MCVLCSCWFNGCVFLFTSFVFAVVLRCFRMLFLLFCIVFGLFVFQRVERRSHYVLFGFGCCLLVVFVVVLLVLILCWCLFSWFVFVCVCCVLLV